MTQEIGLRVLSQIMKWDDDRSREEFAWLNLMARLKYDGYRDFHAGMRFIESLVAWLQQFKQADREIAYDFVRNQLVFISLGEMIHLVEQFFLNTVRERLVQTVARQNQIPTYRVLVEGSQALKNLRRKTLFMGLSDGARLDVIRRASSGSLSNEQFVQSTQIDTKKWEDLLENLREDLDDPQARFRLVYLVDDFMGTGTSFLRHDERAGKWHGKLIRFQESVQSATEKLRGQKLFEPEWELCIHHYVATNEGKKSIKRLLQELKKMESKFVLGWAREMHPSFGTVLPPHLPINLEDSQHQPFVRLTTTYYNPDIETKHTAVGGVTHLGLGYGGCALPLVLEHNTPNNSVALLWAETNDAPKDGIVTHAMRPLFRRRQRHF